MVKMRLRESLAVRLLIPTVATVTATALVCGGIAAYLVGAQMRETTRQDVAEQTSRVMDTLATVNALSSQTVQGAMHVLMAEGARAGAVSLGPEVDLKGRKVPELRLGNVSQTGNFTLVDDVKGQMGGTATLFVRSGEDYVRVSTNVIRADGGRAVGTVLDPKGAAYAAIREGRAFYGVVDILGKPYMTGYEPMRDAKGAVVGIWYTGYLLSSLGDLGQHIAETRILKNGFLALLRRDGKVVFRPDGVDSKVLEQVLSGRAKGWDQSSRQFDPWGYRVVAAWPKSDISSQIVHVEILLLLCAVAIAGLLAVVISTILRVLVIRPVAEIGARLSNADLNTMLETSRRDEIGQLATSFDRFVLRVRKTLLEVEQASRRLTESAAVMSASASVQASASTEGSAEADHMVLAIDEVSATIQGVSESSSEAAAAARQTVDLAQAGQESAQQSAETMQSLAMEVGETARQIGTLEEQSERIGKVLSVIVEIAEQTNLLALNAAIEAARSGEAGRGFAVVAGEVRRLAERTTAATKEIDEVVRSIRAESRRAVEAIASNEAAAGKERDLANATGQHLSRITAMASQAGDRIVQIATAATQQASSMAHIRENVDRMAKLGESTAAEARSTAHACEELSTLADTLHTLIGEFHLGENAAAA
jgi:methyl-accepting chemotaxis protein